MNYVEHHFGDYARDTAHLTMIEHGAYRTLLDVYYVREAPLPRDMKDVFRLARAASPIERKAVEVVLAEFFHLTDEGWAHKRCDIEIARFREKDVESKARQANEAERQRRHRERRRALFDTLREHGKVPSWDTQTDALQRMVDALQKPDSDAPVTRDDSEPETDLSQTTDAPVTRDEDAPVTRTATATHSPLPTPHSPEEKTTPPTPRKRGASRPAAPRDAPMEVDWPCPGGVEADTWAAWLDARRAKRAPMTAAALRTATRVLDQAEAFGHRPQDIVAKSAMNGWQGLFLPEGRDGAPLVVNGSDEWYRRMGDGRPEV